MERGGTPSHTPPPPADHPGYPFCALQQIIHPLLAHLQRHPERGTHDRQRPNKVRLRIEYRSGQPAGTRLPFPRSQRVPVSTRLLNRSLQRLRVGDSALRELIQPGRQDPVGNLRVPCQQNPARRPGMQGQDPSHSHVPAKHMARLGHGDTHPVLHRRLEKANSLAQPVPQLLKDRLDELNELDSMGRRGSPIGHLHTDPVPVINPVNEAVSHKVTHQPLDRRGGKTS
jgi:hypothetical protein